MQLFVKDLTVMDFSYLCPKRGMVGESWIVDVILDGDLNEESMVQDFGKVKKELKYLIDEYVDHKLLVPAEHQQTTIRHDERNGQVEVSFEYSNDQRIVMFCPADAYAFIYASEIKKSSVGAYLKEVLATHLPENVDNISLLLREEVITTPFYHYTHGLKKHDGNCQRIAHGHRSKIDLYVESEIDQESQIYWAKRWEDIYIGSTEDIVEPKHLNMAHRLDDYSAYFCFAYEASQGHFEIVIPKAATEIVDTDSTVECLAEFILSEQIKRLPNKKLRVVAYEGVGKGAMVGN